jgi:NADPH-dependent 2,4-dienoyl-CoA reductase/sulfur reductase-like enzyme
VEEASNKVILVDGTEITYDAVVVCIGARNLSPAEPPASVVSKEYVFPFFYTCV